MSCCLGKNPYLCTVKNMLNNLKLVTMNSEIKSFIETSPEVRDFELRDVTELEIWLPAIRVEGLLTGYFANYVGDSDGLFIVLDLGSWK